MDSCIVDETFTDMWSTALSTDVGFSATSVDVQLLRFWVGIPNSSCAATAAAYGLCLSHPKNLKNINCCLNGVFRN